MGVIFPFFIFGLLIKKLDYSAIYLFCPVAEVFFDPLCLLLA